MDFFLTGIKNLTIGIAALLTAASSPVVSTNSTPLPSPSVVNIDKSIVTRSGEYSYSGYTLKYIVNIPKNGGDIRGSFDGVCKGPITGKFSGGEGGKVEGKAKANCKIAFLSYDLEATYIGKVYLKQGKIDLSWEGKIPYTNNEGLLTINFEPAD